MAANRIKKGSVSRLSSVTDLVIACITHLNNSQDILYVKSDNENDKCQKLKNESTSINDEKIKSDECNITITGSEKCGSVTSMTSHLGKIKCS
ncbi:MAG: hypothetical protein M3M88_02560 [Thermoproteota archaeon]|nr:hypothetical protein [Thermoproteota archaeon]